MGPSSGSTGFDLLHPAVQHHVVNTLGWRALRPLQEQAIEPVLAGEHCLLIAPTAGGKTEAAFLPVLSRMLTEDWRGLSVLYVCPLRALLNNLHVRLEGYGRLVGRRVGLWHGDVGPSERRRLLDDPPDVLLTTPESLEAMLVSPGVDHRRHLGGLRVVIVDEVHAFAGDDRGWHLLAVLERVTRLGSHELQRIALSATVGNPDGLLDWLTATSSGPRRVIDPDAGHQPPPEVGLDYVGSIVNAAVVISRLHRGEKRLVFVDSRARAEQLAVALRERDVTTFVSHGSLGLTERRAAERAFAEERDCVIVATSTLELGIDVGDLDRVIQIDAPPRVASFLQRLGRTGRRPGTTRNALFLATTDDALLRAAALLLAWSHGEVEPVVAPATPLHLVAQQCLALVLQEQGVGRHTWAEWLGSPFVLGPAAAGAIGEITDHLVAAGFVVDDGGLLGIGQQAEESLGRRHFLELLSVFTSAPMLSVRHGRNEIGLVPDETLLARPPGYGAGGPPVLLLAGRSWAIRHIDWARRTVQVEPVEAPGVARWGSSGQPLRSGIARRVRDVLTGVDPPGVTLSRRAAAELAELRADRDWVRPGATTVVRQDGKRVRWWTFAGSLANLWLAQAVTGLRRQTAALDDLSIALDDDATADDVRSMVEGVDLDTLDLADWLAEDALEGLKFADCLPDHLARRVVTARLDDRATARHVLAEPIDGAGRP